MSKDKNNTQDMQIAYARIRGYVEVDSTNDFPFVSISTMFRLNEFPTAVITIPLGKPASSDDKKAVLKASEVAEYFKGLKKIRCIIYADKGEYSESESWLAEEEICIFSGYITGTSLTRTAGSLSLVVHATHWLMDLDASSILSSSIAPGSPLGIFLPIPGNEFASSAYAQDPDFDNISVDVWSQALKPKLLKICEGSRIETAVACGGTTEGLSIGDQTVNTLAKDRLSGNIDAFDLPTYADVPKLSFVQEFKTAIAGHMNAVAGQVMYDGGLGNATMWSKLMEFANLFSFVVIPTVNTAICAPLCPNLAGEDPPRHKTIYASEYFTFSPSTSIYRMPRGVSVHADYIAGFGSADYTDKNYLKSAGCYLVEKDAALPQSLRDTIKHGAMLFIPAPRYADLTTMVSALNKPKTVPKTNPVVSHTMGPPAPEDIVAEEAPSEPEDNIFKEWNTMKTIGDLYAKWYYWMVHYRTHTAAISGKLRLDIAPGSLVRVEDLDGKLEESSTQRSFLYANVTSVSVNIDVNEARAYTSFTLSHVRRETEKLFGVDAHPLYKDKWVGTVLQSVGTKIRAGDHERT